MVSIQYISWSINTCTKIRKTPVVPCSVRPVVAEIQKFQTAGKEIEWVHGIDSVYIMERECMHNASIDLPILFPTL
jgi:hypothetical protein